MIRGVYSIEKVWRVEGPLTQDFVSLFTAHLKRV